MNQFLPSGYVEIVNRLALGVEPMDAQRGARLSSPLQAAYDDLLNLPRPPIERHDSNLFALRYQRGVKTKLDVRFFDAAEQTYNPRRDRRRVVPRRLRIPFLTLAEVEVQEQVAQMNFARRIRRPAFFPGAAYGLMPMATALRGRVVLGAANGPPLRWARVVAELAANVPRPQNFDSIVGRAHGDDRGEFLLLIEPRALTIGELPKNLKLPIEVSVFSPDIAPVPATQDLPERDPLWDLPLEELAAPGTDPDDTASGKRLPANYTRVVKHPVDFILGQCLCNESVFVIT